MSRIFRFLTSLLFTFLIVLAIVTGIVYKFRGSSLPYQKEIQLMYTTPVLHDSLAADTLYTDEQLAELQLEKRSRSLEEQAREIADERSEVTMRLDSIKLVQTSIENLISEKEKIQEEQLKRLTKVYDTMNPEEAAAIMSQLNDRTLLFILQGMKTQNVAGVLAQLDPLRAADISSRLSGI
jgi:flagellar motility protein MotE (MotC chaperone)